jgi:UTP:GlnB (protein PII) uridylyltransferase
MRDYEIDIRKAYIEKNKSTLYLKGTKGTRLSNLKQAFVKEILETGYTDYDYDYEYNIDNYRQIKIPCETEIQMYSVPNINYTTLEFSCKDRIGLLSDMMRLIESFPYQLDKGYISTIGPYAHNLFFLQNNNKALNKNDMTYISNIFEYEIKECILQSNIQDISM